MTGDRGSVLGSAKWFAIAEAEQEALFARLKRGGGGGTSDGMEPRIAKLEAHMEHVRTELTRLAPLPIQVARLEEKVAHLPSKGFVVTTTSTTIALIGAIVIFADKLRAIVGG